MSFDESTRCFGNKDSLMAEYHDKEWGVPTHDESELFGLILLEGAQAGLSWRTVLHRREAYRESFAGFDPLEVSRYTSEKLEDLRVNSGIIRNRLKVESAVANAKAMIEVQKEFGSFDRYIWGFTGGKTVKNKWKKLDQLPAESEESRAMSRDMKKRGFKFCGPVICYAFMQAAGMVNDHLVHCFRYREVGR